MTAYTGLRLITQQDLAGIINDNAKGKHLPMQSGMYDTPKYSGILRTSEELKLHLARMGAGGDGAYAHLILAATKNPDGLATYLPDDNASRGSQQSLPIAEFSRDQSKLQHVPSQTNPNTGKQEKNYHRNAYSYAKYAGIGYFKHAAKAVYGKVESEIMNAVAKMRAVYQSSKGFLKGNKVYKGQDNAPSNVISLDAYRAARERRKYIPLAPSATLEQKVA